MDLMNLDVKGKRVLLRVDYNVALMDGKVAEPKRIEATIPTLRWLLERGAKVIILSHLGRPKGWDQSLSLKPVLETFREISARERLALKSVGLWDRPYPCRELEERVGALGQSEVLFLDNLRFHPGEEKNDLEFARGLARLGDFFVQEAFGAAHRAHASTDALPGLLPSAFGFLVKRELSVLGRLLDKPAHPFVVLLGGFKVSDKIGAIENLLLRGVDKILVGGALAYTFLKANGSNVGKSPVQADWVERVRELMSRPKNAGKILLCRDHAIVRDIKKPGEARVTPDANIENDWMGADVGPKTLTLFGGVLGQAKTIFWNGPVGVMEVAPFDKGSSELARAIAGATQAGALSVLGGGDTIYAVSRAGLDESAYTHISTGGGATLEFLEGKELPGIKAVERRGPFSALV